MFRRLLGLWPLSLLVACSVAAPKPYVPAFDDGPLYVLVPGWLADWGFGDDAGKLTPIRDALEYNGKRVIVAPIKTKNNQATNARIINDIIRSNHGEIVIISGSRGTSEAAIAISEMTPKERGRIGLWVSISGAHLGSMVADWYASSLMHHPTSVWSNIAGWGPMENIREMRTSVSRKRFAAIEHTLRDVPTVSVVTVIRSCDELPMFKRIGCSIVDSAGVPHDGLIAAQDQILPGSRVIWLDSHKHMLGERGQKDILEIIQHMAGL